MSARILQQSADMKSSQVSVFPVVQIAMFMHAPAMPMQALVCMMAPTLPLLAKYRPYPMSFQEFGWLLQNLLGCPSPDQVHNWLAGGMLLHQQMGAEEQEGDRGGKSYRQALDHQICC